MKEEEIIQAIRQHRFAFHDEKMLQSQLRKELQKSFSVKAEYRLDDKNIIDFYIDGIGIEVKIKGSRREIFKQCERYCAFDDIKSIILVTGRSMGLPSTIKGKRTYILNLGQAWL